MKKILTFLMLIVCGTVLAAPLTPGKYTKAKTGSILMDAAIYENPAGNVGIGSAVPRSKLDIDGAVYATTYYGSGANLTNLPASMTYPTGDGVAVVSGGSSWGTTLSTDGTGDCGAGAVCLGNHTHSSYLTTVASDSDWTVHGSYPTACSEGQLVRGIGDALTCITVDGTIYQSKSLASANILVGNGSGVATAVSMSGDVTIDNTGATTIGADKVALSTDTTGNYVAGATASRGLLLTGTEAGTLGLIETCSSNEILKWTGSAWACAADNTAAAGGTAAGGSSTQIQYNNAGVLNGVDGFVYNGTALSYTGNIGLGSTAPSQKLDVNGTVKATGFTGNLTGNVTGDVSGNAGTVTNGVYTSRTINGKALSSNITLTPYDIDMAIYALDTDLAGYVPTSRTVNGKALSANITLTQGDIDLSLYAPKASPAFTGNVGIGTTSPGAVLSVDGALYVGVDTAPTWGGVSLATAGDAFFKGDVEVDGTIYTDATGDTFLNATGGNVGIGTTVPLGDLTIDGTIYAKNITAGGTHGVAKMLCLGTDYAIYSISSGSCY